PIAGYLLVTFEEPSLKRLLAEQPPRGMADALWSDPGGVKDRQDSFLRQGAQPSVSGSMPGGKPVPVWKARDEEPRRPPHLFDAIECAWKVHRMVVLGDRIALVDK